MPYLDGARVLIIPDASTRLSALRTGKIDLIKSVPWSDAESIMATNPEILWRKDLTAGATKLLMANNARPFGPSLDPNAIKVRRAAAVAIDRFAIAEQYHRGNAVVVSTSILPQFSEAYAGDRIKDLPPSQREQFKYNPVRARQLLAEAGYPDGVEIDLNTYSAHADLASVVKAYWDAISIETTIVIREYGAHRAYIYSHRLEGALLTGYSHGKTNMPRGYQTGDGGSYMSTNWDLVFDPWVNDPIKKIFAQIDEIEQDKSIEEFALYVIDKAYEIEMPTPVVYHLWQPWVKGYHGE